MRDREQTATVQARLKMPSDKKPLAFSARSVTNKSGSTRASLVTSRISISSSPVHRSLSPPGTQGVAGDGNAASHATGTMKAITGEEERQLEQPKHRTFWFAAKEYYALALNRTFKVYVSDTMICGARIHGIFANPFSTIPELNYQRYWISSPSVKKYENINPESREFMALDKNNFQVPIKNISRIDYAYGNIWSLGKIPHSGAISIFVNSGKSRKLVLLAQQNGAELKSAIERRAHL